MVNFKCEIHDTGCADAEKISEMKVTGVQQSKTKTKNIDLL